VKAERQMDVFFAVLSIAVGAGACLLIALGVMGWI
jgi:hypothetical protein